MKTIPEDDLLAQSIVAAIKEGQTDLLNELLAEHPELASLRIQDKSNNKRSLLHIATDWPGHFPNVTETISCLIASGADVNAEFIGPNSETPLHWAASSNDVKAIVALLEGGADLNAQGAVIAGGDPLEDAIGFQNWSGAKCLVEHGATTRLGDEAALGMMDELKARFTEDKAPSPDNITYSFWNACSAGQVETAKFLLAKGADIHWIPEWCEESPLDGAIKSGNEILIRWLKSKGADKAEE